MSAGHLRHSRQGKIRSSWVIRQSSWMEEHPCPFVVGVVWLGRPMVRPFSSPFDQACPTTVLRLPFLSGPALCCYRYPLEESAARTTWKVSRGPRIVPYDPAVFAPGLDSYAYTKTTAQRNLYRIPLP